VEKNDLNTASDNDTALTLAPAYSDSPSHSLVETSSDTQQPHHTHVSVIWAVVSSELYQGHCSFRRSFWESGWHVYHTFKKPVIIKMANELLPII